MMPKLSLTRSKLRAQAGHHVGYIQFNRSRLDVLNENHFLDARSLDVYSGYWIEEQQLIL